MTTLGVLITLFVTLFLAVNNLPETSTLLIINEKTLQITDIGLTRSYPQSNSRLVLSLVSTLVVPFPELD